MVKCIWLYSAASIVVLVSPVVNMYIVGISYSLSDFEVIWNNWCIRNQKILLKQLLTSTHFGLHFNMVISCVTEILCVVILLVFTFNMESRDSVEEIWSTSRFLILVLSSCFDQSQWSCHENFSVVHYPIHNKLLRLSYWIDLICISDWSRHMGCEVIQNVRSVKPVQA